MSTETTFSYIPKQWHDFISSQDYSKKVNLTRFYKSIYDHVDKYNLYTEDKQSITCDNILRKLLHNVTIKYVKVQEVIQHLLQYLVSVDGNDGKFYLLLWDYVTSDHFKNEDEQQTLGQFQESTGLRLWMTPHYIPPKNFDSDSSDDDEYEADTEDNSVEEKVDDVSWKQEIKDAYEEYLSDMMKSVKDKNQMKEIIDTYKSCLFDVFGEVYWKKMSAYVPNLPRCCEMKYVLPVLDGIFSPSISSNSSSQVSGFAQPTSVSNELCEFLNIPPYQKVPRTHVTKVIIDYIKDQHLEDPENRRIIHPDKRLERLVGTEEDRAELMKERVRQLIESGKEDRAKKADTTGTLTYFNLQLCLNRHFLKNKEMMTYGLSMYDGWKDILPEIRSRKRKREDDVNDDAVDDVDGKHSNNETTWNVLKRLKSWFM